MSKQPVRYTVSSDNNDDFDLDVRVFAPKQVSQSWIRLHILLAQTGLSDSCSRVPTKKDIEHRS